MSNLIQETDQELMKHLCKLCDKSFPSGRSLGGHMRSHVINSPDHDHQQKKKRQMKKLSSVKNNENVMNSNDLGYELRKDPKKTPKVKDSDEIEDNLVVLDKICKECGKGFQSWKALFGHMKCHSEKFINNRTNNLNQDSLTSQSDNANSVSQIKKSRSRNKRIKRYIVNSTTTATVTTTTITTASSSISMNANNNTNNNNQISSNHASNSIVSEIEQDQESEIAMCLLMLSRDEGKRGNEIESSENCNSSAFMRSTKVESKKPIETGLKIKKIVATHIGVDYIGKSEMGYTELKKITIQNDELGDEIELGFEKYEDSRKRKFECITCNKSFHSYQALGGHKASHNKLNENKPMLNHDLTINGFVAKSSVNHQKSKSVNLGVSSLKKTVVLGTHECPICLKIFSSGQALGSHKRSHMIAEAKLNQQTSLTLIEKVNESVGEIRKFIDLNMLPETMEEDMIMNSCTIEYNPWHWVDTTNHEPTTLLGLL